MIFLLFQTIPFGDWIVHAFSGKTYSVQPQKRASLCLRTNLRKVIFKIKDRAIYNVHKCDGISKRLIGGRYLPSSRQRMETDPFTATLCSLILYRLQDDTKGPNLSTPEVHIPRSNIFEIFLIMIVIRTLGKSKKAIPVTGRGGL
jgi:hypothetical protein